MATQRIPIDGPNLLPESGAFYDRVGNQLAAANQIGNQLALVLNDPGTDEGFYADFQVPQNYVGTPKIVMTGILDGAMSSVTLGVGVRGIVLADNDAADVAYSTEDIANTTTDRADEDMVQVSITLANLVPGAGKQVHYYFFIDSDVNTFTGNVLVTGVFFEYADA